MTAAQTHTHANRLQPRSGPTSRGAGFLPLPSMSVTPFLFCDARAPYLRFYKILLIPEITLLPEIMLTNAW